MARARTPTVDRFGRLPIPREIREKAGLREGVEVEMRVEQGVVHLIPRESGVLLKRIDGVLVASGEAAGDLVAAVEHDRERRSRKLSRA